MSRDFLEIRNFSGKFTKDQAYSNLLEKEATICASCNCNEAKTRLLAIDTILFDVLGWAKEDVEPEKYCHDGYADYAMIQNGNPCLILEAKRANTDFGLNYSFEDRPYTVAKIEHESKEAKNALEQAMEYALKQGCRYVAISNGIQWMFTLSYVQNQPIIHRQVFVFESLDAIKKKFDTFWDCFSPEQLFCNVVADKLMESRLAPAPDKFSCSIVDYPCQAARNTHSRELQFVLEPIWKELTDFDIDSNEKYREFLDSCYCTPKHNEDDERLAKLLITKKESEGLRIQTTWSEGNAENIKKILKTNPERPIVILGRIGHGKTTFLKHFRAVEEKKSLKNYIQIEIDFLHDPLNIDEVGDFVYKSVSNNLYEKYSIDIESDEVARKSLNADLNRFKHSPEGTIAKDTTEYQIKEVDKIKELMQDKHTYLQKVFKHYCGAERQLVAIFFDNLDQRDSEMQERAFLCASRIAKDWSAMVLICLRPGTYYASKLDGVQDSLTQHVFSISSASHDAILKKRFAYAQKIVQGENSNLLAARKDVSLHSPSLQTFFDCCIHSVIKGSFKILKSISNGNCRKMLDDVKTLLTCSHFDTQEVIDKFNEDGRPIPSHHIIKSLLFKDHVHYDPRISSFINLFHTQHANPAEHFVRYMMLEYLKRISNDPITQQYRLISELKNYLSEIGFSPSIINSNIEELLNKKCLEAKFPDEEISKDNNAIRITPLGYFHITGLSKLFQYYDAIIIDTPINDSNVREEIKKLINPKIFTDRTQRTTFFLDYLNKCALDSFESSIINPWKETYSSVLQDIEKAKNSFQKTKED